MLTQSKASLLSDIVASVIIIGVCLTSLFFVFNGYVEFDEGVNLQIPQNIFRHQGYSTGYNGGQLFDPLITTGPTVLLPIAGIFLFTSSPSVEMARLVMLIFLTGTFITAWSLSRAVFGNLAGLLTIILYASLPLLESLGVPVLGEIPAVFFCLLGVIFLRDRRKVLGSLFIGLAVLTKSIFFLAAIALGLALVLEWWLTTKHETSRWKSFPSVFMTIAISIIPFLLWECIKILSLGWAEYQLNLTNLFGLINITNSNIGEGFFSGLAANINGLSTPFPSIPGGVILIFILASFIWAIFQLIRQYRDSGSKTFSLPCLFLVVFSLFYLAWWIFISNSGWWRHLLPGMMVMFLTFSGFLAWIFTALLTRVRIATNAKTFTSFVWVFSGIVLVIGLLLFFFLQPVEMRITSIRQHILTYPATKEVQLQVAEKVSSLLNQGAYVGGWGWWQSPEISTLVNHNFIDLGKSDVRKIADANASKNTPVYLLTSPTQTSIDPSTWDEEKRYAGEEVLDTHGYQLFQYVPQNDIASQLKYLVLREDTLSFNSEIDFIDPRYKPEQLSDGIYPDGWAAGEASVWLKYSSEEKHLIITGSAPLENYQNQPLVVKIFEMGVLISEKTVAQSDEFQWDIPLTSPSTNAPIIKITMQANRTFIPDMLGTSPDGRELSFTIKQIGLR